MKKGQKWDKEESKKNKNFVTAMRNALNGIIHAFKTERNLRIDYIIGAGVLIVSLFFDFTKTELICLFLTIGFVIFSEMINSTVEYVVDLITDEYKPNAKYAKDIAAGGVLVSSSIAVVVAYLLFVDKIRNASNELLMAVISSRAHMLITVLFAVIILTVIVKGIFDRKKGDYVNAFPSSRVAVSFALATYLYLMTKSLLVGGVTLVLAIIVATMKMENGKTSGFRILLSALLGMIIVIAIYELILAGNFIK